MIRISPFRKTLKPSSPEVIEKLLVNRANGETGKRTNRLRYDHVDHI
jgi:hypothetical protein